MLERGPAGDVAHAGPRIDDAEGVTTLGCQASSVVRDLRSDFPKGREPEGPRQVWEETSARRGTRGPRTLDEASEYAFEVGPASVARYRPLRDTGPRPHPDGDAALSNGAPLLWSGTTWNSRPAMALASLAGQRPLSAFVETDRGALRRFAECRPSRSAVVGAGLRHSPQEERGRRTGSSCPALGAATSTKATPRGFARRL